MDGELSEGGLTGRYNGGGGGVKSAAERAENDKPVVPPTTPPKERFRGHNFPPRLAAAERPIVGRPIAPNSERK